MAGIELQKIIWLKISEAGRRCYQIVQQQRSVRTKSNRICHGTRVHGPRQVVADRTTVHNSASHAKGCCAKLGDRIGPILTNLGLEIVKQSFNTRKIARRLTAAVDGLETRAILVKQDQSALCAADIACQYHALELASIVNSAASGNPQVSSNLL